MVFDCTQIFNELDLLEIRLNILDPYVDKFIVLQADKTFSGKDKPFFINEATVNRFDKWKDKLIFINLQVPGEYDSFTMAAVQKDSIRTTLNRLCKPEDIIYYGDIDEIWTPQTEEGKLRQKAYSYYLNMRSSEDWQGTNVFKYKNIKNLNEIRADHTNVIENGGWHFTNIGGAEQIKKKLEAYDHQEFNHDEIKDKLQERINNGEDYVGRKYDWQGKPFEFWVDESELPDYLITNKEKWKNLFQS